MHDAEADQMIAGKRPAKPVSYPSGAGERNDPRNAVGHTELAAAPSPGVGASDAALDACSVTVLHSHSGRRLAKAFAVASNGQVTRRDFDRATWFTVRSLAMSGIYDLHRLLQEIESDPSICLIRGAPQAGSDLQRQRRKKRENGGIFAEVPRHWLMVDLDGVPLPPGTSVLEDPRAAARALMDLLAAHAPELEDVTAAVQFSSSAGLEELAEAEENAGFPPRWRGVTRFGVSGHIWLWLRTPLGEAELTRWLEPLQQAGLKIDAATVRTVQPHYTAAPTFAAPLRDPLAGRRTVLIEGLEDAVELAVPAPNAGAVPADCGGSCGLPGRGYLGYLNDIGGAPGFRRPILQAIAAYVATTWPDVDLSQLKADLRRRIFAADPGGRPQATIERYASDQHLDQIIAWVLRREGEKRAAQAEARRQPIAPSFPDCGVPLTTAQAHAAGTMTAFSGRLREGQAPELLLQVTVGAGKSEAAITAAPSILDAAREGGRSEALYYLVPRHDLGEEVRARFLRAHPGTSVAIWRGMDAEDPTRPGKKMCLDPELPRMATSAGHSATEACPACPLRQECGYRGQRQQKADVWIAAHNLAFHTLPSALPEAAAVVIDEAFWPASLVGTDPLQPVQLAVSALQDDRTGGVTGLDRQRLLFLRRRVADVLALHPEGGLLREAFEGAGFTTQSAEEWYGLEWRTRPELDLAEGMDRSTLLGRLQEAKEQGFTPLRPRLAKFLQELLAGADARSVNASVARNVDLGRGQGAGDVVRLAWRQPFTDWLAPAPKVFLDGTTSPDLLRPWAPRLETVRIEVQAPQQRVRQVVGRQFGRAFFQANANNVGRLANLVTFELAEATGEVLVVAQMEVEAMLRAELQHRFDGALPGRLHLAHYGAITGLDRFRDVERVVVAGRPALNRLDGEQLAAVVKGAAVEVVADGEAALWPTVTGGIRRADGSGTALQQPCHPDPLVEALRWSISEGAVLQATAVALSSIAPRDDTGHQLRQNLVRTLARAAARELWLADGANKSRTASAAPHRLEAGNADH